MLGLSVRLLRFRSLVVDVPLLEGSAPMFLGWALLLSSVDLKPLLVAKVLCCWNSWINCWMSSHLTSARNASTV